VPSPLHHHNKGCKILHLYHWVEFVQQPHQTNAILQKEKLRPEGLSFLPRVI
jgi:hypothetical protein